MTAAGTALADELDDVAARKRGRRLTSDRAALIAFLALVVIALPLIVFSLADHAWFLMDEWAFLAGRGLSVGDLFEPANGHWNTLPLIIYRGMWRVVGLRSYVPYQAMSVAMHLVAAVLLRVIMRRAGVRPWLATFAAALYVLFGPGAENITWAFEIGYVGALVFGLTHAILADHDGPWDRRDWLGLGAGVLGLMSSGIAPTFVFVVGLAVLWRRGWRMAALHTAPLAALYCAYLIVEQPEISPFARPNAESLVKWVARSLRATFEGIGHYPLLGATMAVLLITGWVIAARSASHASFRERACVPGALFAGVLYFAFSTGFTRWGLGTDAAAAGRYVHISAALTLPALAFAAESVISRWPRTLVPIVVLLVVPLPLNAGSFDDYMLAPGFFAHEKSILLAAPRMPFAREVPRDELVIEDLYMRDVTIGFMLDASRSGKLPSSSEPVPEATVNELKVRLGVHQAGDPPPPAPCTVATEPLPLSPRKGDVIRIATKVNIATGDGGPRQSPRVLYDPAFGDTLTIELDDLDLRFSAPPGQTSFEVCV